MKQNLEVGETFNPYNVWNAIFQIRSSIYEGKEIIVLSDQCGIPMDRKEMIELKEAIEQTISFLSDEQMKRMRQLLIFENDERYYWELYDRTPDGIPYKSYMDARRRERDERITSQLRQPSRPISSPGFIYILFGNGVYKIGKTKNPKQRKTWLDIKLPFAVEIHHLIKTNNMIACEYLFHDRYNQKRINGEWFNLTAEDVAEIKLVEQMDF